MNKSIVIKTTYILGVCVASYLISLFIYIEPNPELWHWWYRLGISVVALIIIGSALESFDEKQQRIQREDWAEKLKYIEGFADGQRIETEVNGNWEEIKKGCTFKRSAKYYRFKS
ncbi:hypothetical protein A3715_34030 [Oleiphilus sp. HI0009]|nr:hypothetical protein A3715_11440 [Oleiphilus sp. HI0009]KZX82443.1 hypothetical protein A3715_34030 [Oleiphilus sp. HI0009]